MTKVAGNVSKCFYQPFVFSYQNNIFNSENSWTDLANNSACLLLTFNAFLQNFKKKKEISKERETFLLRQFVIQEVLRVGEIFLIPHFFSGGFHFFIWLPIPFNYINPPINAIISYWELKLWDERESSNRQEPD